MNTVFNTIKALLEESRVAFTLTEHEAVRTSEEAAKVRGVALKTGAKAMVVKAANEYYLFVLPADCQLHWKKVKVILGVKEIRFATVEEAEELTAVKMGSVPPFGNILGLKTYYDRRLLENEYVNFNPGSLTHSVQMSPKDLVALASPEITHFIK